MAAFWEVINNNFTIPNNYRRMNMMNYRVISIYKCRKHLNLLENN